MLTNDQKAAILDMILDVLRENMNLEQVSYCNDCHFWGTAGERTEGSPVYNPFLRQCRKYGMVKTGDDYCSDGVLPSRRKEE